MALVEWVSVPKLTTSSSIVKKVTLANGDFSQTLVVGHLTDNTVQVTGTFGTGGSVTLYGSNNEDDIGTAPGTGTWVALEDNLGNAVTKTAAGGDVIVQSYALIAARVTAGDGTTALTVRLKLTEKR